MQKRGQLTFFLIVGIVLIIILGMVLYLRSTPSIPDEEQPSNINPEIKVKAVDHLVQSCTQEVLEDAIVELGRNGGFIINRPADVRTQLSKATAMPIYYFESQNLLPSLKYMENELAEYITAQVRYCYDDFIHFDKQLNIKQGINLIYANVSINDNAVTAKLSVPLNIQSGDQQFDRQEYTASVPIHLKEIWKEAQIIIDNVEACEDATVQFIETAINSCNTDPNFSSIQCDSQAFFPNKEFVKSYEIPFTDCELDRSSQCDLTTFTINLKFKLTPLSNCKAKDASVQEYSKTRNIHLLYDPTYDKKEFAFAFVTRMNLDSEGSCNTC